MRAFHDASLHRPQGGKHLPPWLGRNLLRLQDFGEPDYHFSNVDPGSERALLTGQLHHIEVQPGMWLHSAEVGDLLDASCTNPSSAGLRVVMLLDGWVDVSFDDYPLQLSVPAGVHGAQAQGAVINTRHTHQFGRRWQRGKFERKLSFFLEPGWLEAQGLTPALKTRRHREWFAREVGIQGWTPSVRAVAVAEQILCLLRSPEPSSLMLVSRSFELVHEAWQALNEQTPEAGRNGLPPRGHLRLAHLQKLLHGAEGQAMTVDELARKVGLSTSALQRQFRDVYGNTVDEYRRDIRLDQAWARLEQTGCSVSEVAWAAGYSSAANFSTAFKRKFGISPKWVRTKL
ncbi:MAG: AraC family transcriptional regulator [Pigmentiphaga sp.]|nr:AraC family transcriptional regulator [Pigmentiphaga sp.]